MSYMRFVFRHVYRQFHELSDGSAWNGTSGQRNDPRGIFGEAETCQEGRLCCYGYA